MTVRAKKNTTTRFDGLIFDICRTNGKAEKPHIDRVGKAKQ